LKERLSALNEELKNPIKEIGLSNDRRNFKRLVEGYDLFSVLIMIGIALLLGSLIGLQ